MLQTTSPPSVRAHGESLGLPHGLCVVLTEEAVCQLRRFCYGRGVVFLAGAISQFEKATIVAMLKVALSV
jgi:hypothetical protein